MYWFILQHCKTFVNQEVRKKKYQLLFISILIFVCTRKNKKGQSPLCSVPCWELITLAAADDVMFIVPAGGIKSSQYPPLTYMLQGIDIL